jgi:hypothetical protein
LIAREATGKSMNPEDKKRIAAEAAVDHVKPDSIIGVGTGSTVNHFIDLLAAKMARQVKAAVSSSEASSERLRGHGIKVVDLNEIGKLDLYVARKNCRRGQPGIRLHRRRQQAGRCAGPFSATGRSNSDGARTGSRRAARLGGRTAPT